MRMACTQTRQNVGITICRRQFVYNLPFSLLSSRPRPRPQLPMSPMLTLQACVSHTPKNRYPHQCQCLVLAQKNVGIQLFLARSMPQCVFWPSKHCVYYDYDEARVVIIATVSWGTAKQFTIAIAIGSWKGPTGYDMHPHPAEPNGTASTSTYEHSPHEDVVCCMFACMHVCMAWEYAAGSLEMRGIEPPTFCMRNRRSTTELHPHAANSSEGPFLTQRDPPESHISIMS